MSNRRALCLAVLGTLSASLCFAAEPDPDLAYAERTLKEAGVAIDGAGLLAFFRARTLSESDQERLVAAVRQLGDERFATREKASRDLAAAGRTAVPFLRTALSDVDLEVSQRTQLCLDEIQQQPSSVLVMAAARLLCERRPAGTIEALLGYLPCADEEPSEEAVFFALARLGVQGGKPDATLMAALEDKHPLRRAAAAQIIGQVAGVQKRISERLLVDTDPRVRFESARALARVGERSAVPVLIALLGEGPVRLAWQTEDLLSRLAGDQGPTVPLGGGTGAARRLSRAAWEDWWQTNQGRVDWSRLQGDEQVVGLTLVCEYDGNGGGRVWECGKDGKQRWRIGGLQGPNDAQVLPGGRVLIAERNASRVTERDRNGKILWQQNAPGSAIACQRLANGNTLITTFSELFEVTPDHKKVLSHTHQAGFRHAVRLKNGNVVYVASNGQVGELDPSGKPIRTITPEKYAQGAGYWASVEALPSGRFLLALGSANKVVEIEATGKIAWECNVNSPVHATRLHNGRTLVACFEGRVLVEVDRAGKEVSRQALSGRPFTVRRY